FNEGVLSWFSGLYVCEGYIIYFTPCLNQFGYELRSVIHANRFRFSVAFNQSSEYPSHTTALDGIVDLYVENFAVVIVYDVEGSYFSAVFQCIAHKVHAPTFGKGLRNDQRLFYSFDFPLLALAAHRQPGLFINPVQAFMVDGFSLVT